LEEHPQIYLYRRIVKAKLYIDANYASALDLDNIADEASFSKFHFIRLFKKIYGRAPHQYLTRLRIEKASQLLRLNTSVTQTCFEVGFHSVSSFTALFRKHTGLSPSEYLAHNQKYLLSLRSKPLLFIPGCFADSKGWK
jgi:AraC-like DNA-binding protein